MRTKEERLETICQIIANQDVSSQEELLSCLNNMGYSTTQATLSRDIRQLGIAKVHIDGSYVYRLPEQALVKETQSGQTKFSHNLEFSGNLAIVKTSPGYAMGIASDIDEGASEEILGTIAGDDTILVIPREGYSRSQIEQAILSFLKD